MVLKSIKSIEYYSMIKSYRSYLIVYLLITSYLVVVKTINIIMSMVETCEIMVSVVIITIHNNTLV